MASFIFFCSYYFFYRSLITYLFHFNEDPFFSVLFVQFLSWISDFLEWAQPALVGEGRDEAPGFESSPPLASLFPHPLTRCFLCTHAGGLLCGYFGGRREMERVSQSNVYGQMDRLRKKQKGKEEKRMDRGGG